MFTNPAEGRLRAGWRILLFVLLFWVFAALIFVLKPVFGDITKREYLSRYSLVIVAVLAFAASVAVAIARKYLDKKSFRSLGLGGIRRALPDVLFGFFLSAAMAGGFLLVTLAFGLVEITAIGMPDTPGPGLWDSGFGDYIQVMSGGVLFFLLMEHILVGYWEELVFRGYLFDNLSDGMGQNLAIGISCAIYGLIHATNPNAGILSTGIIMFFGFLRIYGLLATGFLWLSIGMHIGWNFFQGPVFGFGASGHQMASLLELEISGPDWASGGEFGPEGSLLILPILALALLTMRWWGSRNKPLGN
ncbi:CPBP family intramembrane glutamic endopeptidase [Robiginitalea sp. SC105]|uniref:CPBP family intramembrane glutamic endopeptidase n=1 Tax=Robiginitalea sp. SC105 TaxID=2762332 RepID=UPI00163B0D92|nr:type II CAAX endopeptidase family protein [Robiginitalea sp. SC105]MBC2839144.1 CPBP family intramembrane metalloprotease [Robiginitalea sp. SC105]